MKYLIFGDFLPKTHSYKCSSYTIADCTNKREKRTLGMKKIIKHASQYVIESKLMPACQNAF